MSEAVFSKLSTPLKKEVSILGWDKATQIQELAIPEILGGDDILLIAPTGTGKTEAAVFPVFEQLFRERVRTQIHGMRARM